LRHIKPEKHNLQFELNKEYYIIFVILNIGENA